VSDFLAESMHAERTGRAHLGAAQCRAAIAPVLAKRHVPINEDYLTDSERIHLRARQRAARERRRAA
jgi:hypothetical protein